MQLSLLALGAFIAGVSAFPQVNKRGTYETGVPIEAPSQTQAAATGTTWNVMVGGSAGLVYTPEYVMANVGDVVVFSFGPKNHTVTQSTFGMPCMAMPGGMCLAREKLMVGQDSGFEPTDGTTTPTYQITVMDTSPQCMFVRCTR
jgi:plastocyanin